MSQSPFAAPAAAGAGVDLKTLTGSLLLITVQGQEHGVNTVHGPADPIRADIAVLDGTLAGETYDDTLIFPKVLTSQLKGRIGQKVLGRLGQGVAKPGQSAPWVLGEATAADNALGVAHLAKTALVSADTPPF